MPRRESDQRLHSGGEATHGAPRKPSPSEDGEVWDDDANQSHPLSENLYDLLTHSARLRETILPYVRPALEVIVLIVVLILLYAHCKSPDYTERALLDVLKERCGKDSANAKRCIQKQLTPKNSGNTCKYDQREECVTPDLSHLESKYEKLKQQVNRLLDNKWISTIESVFEDSSEMSAPLKYLKENYGTLETMSSAGTHRTDEIDVSGDVDRVKKLEDSIRDVDNELTTTKIKLHKTRTELTETNMELTETNTELTEINSKLTKVEGSISQQVKWRGQVEDTVIPSLTSQIEQSRKTAEDAQQAIDVTGGKLKDHIVWANSTYAEFETHRNDTNRKVSEFATKHDVTERKLDGEELDGAMTKAELNQLKGKSSVHDITLFLTLLNILAVVFVVIYVRQTLSSAPAASTATTPASRNNAQQRGYRREKVYELSWSRPMEESVCVVVFHTESEERHADQTRSVFEFVKQPCPTIHTRVIRCVADIKDLPGSRVFLVFVDFNERNVILEDPTKGLGDLRVTTVRSLWRFGADVTVIYCGDQGSVKLDNRLFNQDLGSIHRQQELTQLKNDDRILSIYTDFSNTQKQHCRIFINRLLHIT